MRIISHKDLYVIYTAGLPPHLKHPGTENAWEWDISMSLHEANRPFPPIHIHMDPIDHVPKQAWLQVTVTSQAILMRQKMTVNGKFIQRRGCELAAKCYHELHLKSL